MNVNYGLFPEIETFDTKGPDGKRLKGADRARSKKRAMSVRALRDIEGWLSTQMAAAVTAGA
jgi:methylenetetrahydrofolate--tRNA-(uracil-5-)-methyltransferase